MSYDFDYYAGRHIKLREKPKKPFLGKNPSAIEARAFADALEDYERELESYKEDQSYYRSQLSVLALEFEDKLKKDYGLCDQEYQVLWNEAWDRGHSAGLEEVYSEFDSLFHFVKKYIKVMQCQ